MRVNGLSFDLDKDRIQPIGESEAKCQSSALINHLKSLEKNGFLRAESKRGLIVFADD